MEKIAIICWNTHDRNDLREAKESLCMGIPMKTRQGLGMRNGFWMTHVFMSLMAITMPFSTNEC